MPSRPPSSSFSSLSSLFLLILLSLLLIDHAAIQWVKQNTVIPHTIYVSATPVSSPGLFVTPAGLRLDRPLLLSGQDVSATLSAMNAIIQQLLLRTSALEANITTINNKLAADEAALSSVSANVTSLSTLPAALSSLNTTVGMLVIASQPNGTSVIDQQMQLDISNLQTTTAASFASITNSMNDLSTTTNFAQSAISLLNTSMISTQSSISTINTNINSITTNVNFAQSAISLLNATTATQTVNINTLTNSVNSLTTTTNFAQSAISLLNSSMIATTNAINTINNNINSLTTNTNFAQSAIALLNSTTATQTASINTLTTNLNAVTTTANFAQTAISYLNNTVAANTNSINTLTANLAATTTTANFAQQAIALLNSTTTTQTTSINTLNSQMTTANSNLALLNQVNAVQNNSIASLTTTSANMQTAINMIQTADVWQNNTLATAQANIASATTTAAFAQSAISSLNITVASLSSTLSTATYGFKNRIVNGAFLIDQLYAGSLQTPANGALIVDSWGYGATQANIVSTQQILAYYPLSIPYTSYLAVTVLTPMVVGATDFLLIRQAVACEYAADLNWGTAAAVPVTLSFYTQTNQVGVYTVAINNITANNAASTRGYAATYTIAAAGVWQFVSVSIMGDTLPNNWYTTPKATYMVVRFGLAAGSAYTVTPDAWTVGNAVGATGQVNWAQTSGNYFWLTGVQLERGLVPTPYDYRPYSMDLFYINSGDASVPQAGFKNRVVNGHMILDQANNGALVAMVSASYIIDQWVYGASLYGLGVFTCQQLSSTPPPGFHKYITITSTAVVSSPGVGQYAMIHHQINGTFIGDLQWGKSTASPVTISFWVQSSLIGVYTVTLRNSPFYSRTYVSAYTITSANAWQYVTVTVPGDSSVAWYQGESSNSAMLSFALGLGPNFIAASTNTWIAGNWLGATGQNNLAGVIGQTWSITGIQLEKGTSATSFDYRPAAQEIVLSAYPGLTMSTLANSNFAFKNRVLNGAFTIDQMYAGTPQIQSITTNAFVDGWISGISHANVMQTQQVTAVGTLPIPFSSYLAVTAVANMTVNSGDYLCISQNILGEYAQDLLWGTAQAQTVTLSFWVYSNVTGFYGGSLSNSGGTRSYVFKYTISYPNQWQYLTYTIAGDTVSSSWYTTPTAAAMVLTFSLATGSAAAAGAWSWMAGAYKSATGQVNLAQQVGSYWYITGIQLEKAISATSFEFRPQPLELFYLNWPTPASGAGGLKNRVLNGHFLIDQTNRGSLIVPASPSLPIVDNWVFGCTQPNVFSTQQLSASPPNGFGNYVTFTSLVAFAPGISDWAFFRVPLLGSAFADLNWGSANAQPLTLSFYMMSSVAGVYTASLRNPNAWTRSFLYGCSVPANIWTKCSVVIPGDTTTVWYTSQSALTGYLGFTLGGGANYVGVQGWNGGNFFSVSSQSNFAATVGQTWSLTGVQLELGVQATVYDYRPYQQELSLLNAIPAATSGFYSGLKNRIVNGDMILDSLYNGAVHSLASASIIADGWGYKAHSSATIFSAQQMSTNPPVGFASYINITSVATLTPAAADHSNLRYDLYGSFIADLNWGTAAAVPVTLSFYAMSSITGTFFVTLSTASAGTTYVQPYVISTANQWQQYAFTILGETTQAWYTGQTTIAMSVRFQLVAGSIFFTTTTGAWVAGNFLSTSAAANLATAIGQSWSVTGVQLEKGIVATSFDYHPAPEELMMVSYPTPAPQQGFKNRIVNGHMILDQTNKGASISPTPYAYTIDQWLYQSSGAPVGCFSTQQQSTTPPDGFSKYLTLTSTAIWAAPVGSNFVGIAQPINGTYLADLSWGYATAQPVTLSFWARSSVTGLFSVSLVINPSFTRSYVFPYTITAANAWQFFSTVIPGDQTTVWYQGDDVSCALLSFCLGVGPAYISTTSNVWLSGAYGAAVGQVNLAAAPGQSWSVTGIQLEKGTAATSFDYRPAAEEIVLSAYPGTTLSSVGSVNAGLKNRILNGQFNIDQVNAGTLQIPLGAQQFMDGWVYEATQANILNTQQIVAAAPLHIPFNSYLAVTSLAPMFVNPGDYLLIRQQILGEYAGDLQWGTAAAQSVTLSFWVNTNVIGVYGGDIQNKAGTRKYVFSYYVSTSGVWQYVVAVIAGDTFSSTWYSGPSSVYMFIRFCLVGSPTLTIASGSWTGAAEVSTTGQVNLAQAAGKYWWITGVQLEKGISATSFDYRPVSLELMYLNWPGGAQPQMVGPKNRINNGMCQVDTVYNGLAHIPLRTGGQSIDGWLYYSSLSNIFTLQQLSTTSIPFSHCLRAIANSVMTLNSNDYVYIQTNVATSNAWDLNWGSTNTAQPQPVTLSFWQQATVVGTYSGSIRSGDSSRSYPFVYSTAGSATWTQFTITIPADVVGSWYTTAATSDTAIYLSVIFSLGVGSNYQSGSSNTWQYGNYLSATTAVNVGAAVNNVFAIAGVQLERGVYATTFDGHSYSQDLQLLTSEYYNATVLARPGFVFPFTQAATLVQAMPLGQNIESLTVRNWNTSFAVSGGQVTLRFSFSAFVNTAPTDFYMTIALDGMALPFTPSYGYNQNGAHHLWPQYTFSAGALTAGSHNITFNQSPNLFCDYNDRLNVEVIEFPASTQALITTPLVNQPPNTPGIGTTAWTTTFTAYGGQILIEFSGTASSTGGSLANTFTLYLDGNAVSGATLFFNPTGVHQTVPTLSYVAGYLSAGSHTISIGTSSSMKTDTNDWATFTIFEFKGPGYYLSTPMQNLAMNAAGGTNAQCFTSQFTSHGGSLRIQISATAFTPTASNYVQHYIYIDSVLVYTNVWFMNLVTQHMTLPTVWLTMNLGAGTHTMIIASGTNTQCDVNERANVVIIEQHN